MREDEHQALIDYLVGLGATEEDLALHRGDLRGLSSILALRLGRPVFTLADVATRAGVGVDVVTQRWRAAGFPDPGPDAVVASEAEAELLVGLGQVEQLFGRDAVQQLTRVIGSSTSRIADAVVSTFLVNIPLPEHDDLGVAKTNTEAFAFLPLLFRGIEVFLRRHILLARRSLLEADRDAGVEIQQLAIGFVDLVSSTALTHRLSTAELSAALGEFESIAADTVTDHGARLVKLIGDEVMYSAADPLVACRIALALADRLRAHRVLPPVRGGVAAGAVMVRDGDCFGPVVNLAARAVKVAEPGRVVVSENVAAAVHDAMPSTPLPPLSLAGFADVVSLFMLTVPQTP